MSRASRQGTETICVYGNMRNKSRIQEAHDGLATLSHDGNPIKYHELIPLDASGKDTRLDSTPMHELITLLETCISEFEPNMIVIPEPGAFHQEHRAMSQAAMAALRPTGGTNRFRPELVAIYEEPSDYWTIEPDQHNLILHIELTSDDVQRKCAAMQAHKSQDRPHPSERSARAIEALATLRGSQAGVEYAEVYEVRKWLI